MARWAKDLPPDLFPDMQKAEQDVSGTFSHVEWHLLSTFQPHESGPTNQEQAAAICPRCFMELPLTGVCDNCG